MEQAPDPLDPQGDADMPAFRDAIQKHPDMREVAIRFAGLEAEVESRGITSSNRITQWSRLRHGSLDHVDKQRRDLHGKLADSFFKGAERPENQSQAVFVIGPPGAGKSTYGVPLVEEAFGQNFVRVNADDVKEQLPEYEGWNAAALHEESTYVAELLVRQVAVARQHNLLMDMTGKDCPKVQREMGLLSEAGYAVYLLLVHVPPWLAARRVWERFQNNPFDRNSLDESGSKVLPGRFVPPDYAYKSVADKPDATFKSILKNKCVDGCCRIDYRSKSGNPTMKKIEYKGWP